MCLRNKTYSVSDTVGKMSAIRQLILTLPRESVFWEKQRDEKDLISGAHGTRKCSECLSRIEKKN